MERERVVFEIGAAEQLVELVVGARECQTCWQGVDPVGSCAGEISFAPPSEDGRKDGEGKGKSRRYDRPGREGEEKEEERYFAPTLAPCPLTELTS
jgi:hypothetical protein